MLNTIEQAGAWPNITSSAPFFAAFLDTGSHYNDKRCRFSCCAGPRLQRPCTADTVSRRPRKIRWNSKHSQIHLQSSHESKNFLLLSLPAKDVKEYWSNDGAECIGYDVRKVGLQVTEATALLCCPSLVWHGNVIQPITFPSFTESLCRLVLPAKIRKRKKNVFGSEKIAFVLGYIEPYSVRKQFGWLSRWV